MNVIFDYQAFYYQRFGGVSRYFSRLIEVLSKRTDLHCKLPLEWTANMEGEALRRCIPSLRLVPPLLERQTFLGAKRIRRRLYSLFPSWHPEQRHQYRQQLEMSRCRYDIFHPTYYEDYYLRGSCRPRVVLTVFDMIFELFPECYSDPVSSSIVAKKRNVILSASRLIAISESTKRDICRFYHIPQERVVVIPLANTLQQSGSVPMLNECDTLPERYILFVGTRRGYKNFSFFLDSVASLLRAESGLHLICTGDEFTCDETRHIELLGLSGRVRRVGVYSDATLAMLYGNAVVLVCPSLYEGFGLPVLEAMSCSCPVIVSNTSSMPEVAGDAALYIDPRDADSIYKAVARVVASSQLRQELQERGRRREKAFSWDRVAEATVEAYRSVL